MTEIGSGNGPNSGGSVLTSLRELARLEAARVRELADALERRREAERAKAEAEAAARSEIARAEARRVEEEGALRAERERRNEVARLALRAAAIEEARIAAEHRARAEEATRAHERALALLAARPTPSPRRTRRLAFVAATFGLAVAAAAAYATTRFHARDVEASRMHSMDVEATAIAEGQLRAAKETIARLDAQLGEARRDARATRAIVDQARIDLDALRAACRRSSGLRSQPGRTPANQASDALLSGGCKPGDPLCGTIGPPGR